MSTSTFASYRGKVAMKITTVSFNGAHFILCMPTAPVFFTRDGEAARYFSDNIEVGMVCYFSSLANLSTGLGQTECFCSP
ncbi:MAG: hypothetical protein HRT51_19375 [Colwellia sp.]|nr:hypothetical protein [Colwellia sp.]